MAHKTGQKSSSNGRDSVSKRLGIKLYGGQKVLAGGIIVRQRGSKHHAGKGVGTGQGVGHLEALGAEGVNKGIGDGRFIFYQ